MLALLLVIALLPQAASPRFSVVHFSVQLLESCSFSRVSSCFSSPSGGTKPEFRGGQAGSEWAKFSTQSQNEPL